MATVSLSTTLPVPARTVWDAIGGFNSLARWHPAVAKSEESKEGTATIRRLTLHGGGSIVERLEAPDDQGRLVRVTVDLQEDFALNQPLAPFALAAVELFERDDPGYALDIVSVVEAVLEDPGVVLAAQRNKARSDLVAELKATGMEYEERMSRLDEVTYLKQVYIDYHGKPRMAQAGADEAVQRMLEESRELGVSVFGGR